MYELIYKPFGFERGKWSNLHEFDRKRTQY